jgi:hypothetical protein
MTTVDVKAGRGVGSGWQTSPDQTESTPRERSR